MKTEILKKIYEIFKKNSADIYLVGGAVRDILMEKEVNDLDFATSLTPQEVNIVLKKEGIHTYPIGIEFGTIGAILGEKEVQITTFRKKEKYSPKNRKPEIEFGKTIEEDLSRRDFTINAMALTPKGELIDPFNGKEDIKKGIIRTPLNPDTSFSDDPLRMLRAFRFQSQLGFKIESKTLSSIKKNAFRIMFLSQERIQMEMDKILTGEYVTKALEELLQSQLASFFIHELIPLKGLNQSKEFHHKDVWKHTLRVVQNVPSQLHLKWAALLHDIAKPYTRTIENGEIHFYRHPELGAKISYYILSRLKYPKNFIRKVCFLVLQHMRPAFYSSMWSDTAIRRFTREMGDNLQDILSLARADITSYRPERVKERLSLLDELYERIKKIESIKAPSYPVNGNEIMKRFNISPSPLVGKIKEFIREGVEEGKLPLNSPDKEIYFQYAQKKLIITEKNSEKSE